MLIRTVAASFALLAATCSATTHDHQQALHAAHHHHGHEGHDHSDAEHMREAHGVYRAPTEDGDNPYPLRTPDFLRSDGEEEFDRSFETPQRDSIFSGLSTFAHLPFAACLSPFTADLPALATEVQPGNEYDIAFVGMPFDTAVSFRPGARFGPSGIREGSKRISKHMGYNVPLGLNPFKSTQKIVDCGDIPVTAYNNKIAVDQMQRGYARLLNVPTITKNVTVEGQSYSKPLFGKRLHPKLLTLGGDHTIVLPILRSLHQAYGPISVIHFDSHLDTWKPNSYGGDAEGAGKGAVINHGTFFWHAAQEGLIRNGSSTHAGIRTRLSDPSDYTTDAECGFTLNEARIIDEIGPMGIAERIRKTVGDSPVYVSIDIDVLDPSAAPATGTPETGGWSSRELRTILRALEGLNIVGADVVEVAPHYDNQAALTQTVAADLMYELMTIMVKRGPLIDVPSSAAGYINSLFGGSR